MKHLEVKIQLNHLNLIYFILDYNLDAMGTILLCPKSPSVLGFVASLPVRLLFKSI